MCVSVHLRLCVRVCERGYPCCVGVCASVPACARVHAPACACVCACACTLVRQELRGRVAATLCPVLCRAIGSDNSRLAERALTLFSGAT
eukprot:577466-Pleurochrysis_carterae.AAC.1